MTTQYDLVVENGTNDKDTRRQEKNDDDTQDRDTRTVARSAARAAKAEKELTIEVAHPKVVPPVEWLAARNEFLTKEKELTRLRDELSRQRRALPWGKVEKRYEFDSPGAR
jgi:Bacterial protein of unknown function (DUF899)